MRVAIDATPLILSSGGLARYTSELSRALACEFPEDEFFLVSDQRFDMPDGAPANLKRGDGPVNSLERRWWLWGVQRQMDRLGAVLFHGTNFAVPYLPRRPGVMTLHDLSPWMDASWHRAADRVRRSAPILIGLGQATMIVTDSEAVRKQAMERFRINPQRIVSIPLAASPRFGPARQNPELFGGRRFFLFTGTLEPRKNIAALIRAWRLVRDRHDVDLVLVGRRRADMEELHAEPGLRILGELADEDLPALYSNALAFVYPSLYEGFGLPVLEAMQCGACVITSTDPAIGEVTGDAAIRLDPQNEGAWVAAMMACAISQEWMGGMREKSLRRSQEFTWSRTARLTREVYAEAERRFGR